MKFRCPRIAPTTVLGALVFSCVAGPGLRSQTSSDFVLPEMVLPQLDPILRGALGQAPDMFRANLDREEAEASMLASSSRLYPQVTSRLQYNLQKDDRFGGGDSGDRFYYNLTLTQPVFHWGSIRAGADSGRALAAIKSNDEREMWRQLAISVRSQYMVLVIRSAELRKARTDLDSQRRKLVVLKAQQEAGQATAGAVSGLDFAIAEGELAVDRLQFAFEGAVKRFARVCGLESFDPTALPEGIPAVDTSDPVETEPLRGGFVQGEGLENRVPYANLELQLRREELALRQVRSELRPKLNFQVEANQEQLKFSGDAANRNVKSFFTGVQVQWNIFDGFATRGRARASKLRIRKLEERLATVREDLATEAGAAAKEVEFAGRALGFAERRFRSSTGSLTELRKRRAEDRATEIEVLDAEQGERTAQLNAFKARADYLNSIVIFLSIVDADPMVNTFGRNVRRP